VSESSKNIAGGKRSSNATTSEPFVLPKWAIDITRFAGRMLSRLLWRIKYTGLENVPASGGFIIASNHQTYIDPFWIGFPISRPIRFLAWNRIFDWPVLGRLTGLLGAWPLEIEGSDPTAIRRSLQWLRSGGGVVIFPEGGRGRPDGEMIRFKPGAVRMAAEAGVPILPVTIRGAHRVWAKTQKFPRLARVEIVYHPLFYIESDDRSDARANARLASERLKETIGSVL
jgi:1-acyl-sn-glycerol-3-phosphate acyltransferase